MKVFLSSTYIDLIEHRKAAHDALERLGQEVGRMEIFGARAEEATSVALDQLEKSDLIVGIYAYRYGFIPEGSDISITEQEYLHAKSKGKPVLCFVVNEDQPWSPKMMEKDAGKIKKLEDFKAKILKEKVVDFFTTPDDLGMKIATSVHNYLEEHKPVSESPSSINHSSIKPTGNTLPTQPYFFGRVDELKTIAAALSPDSRTWGALIDGPGGIGKTALAIKAAHDAPAELFERKIFITAKVRELTAEGEKKLTDFTRPTYLAMLDELGKELGEENISRLAPDDRANTLRLALGGKKSLIIFDNLEALSEGERMRLFEFNSRLPEGNKAIVTSRRRLNVEARIVRLDRLSHDEAMQMVSELAMRNRRLARTSQQELEDLYAITQGNPLFIRWIVGQLGRESSQCRTIAEAYTFLTNAPLDNDPLEYIFGDLLETFTENETKVLAALTHFTQHAKLKWLAEMTGLPERAAETALEDLTDRSLLIAEPGMQTYFLPQLAAQFMRTRRPETVVRTGDTLIDRAYALAMLYGGDTNYEGFKALDAEWDFIAAALLRMLEINNHLLQKVCDKLFPFLDFTGRWDDILWLAEQSEMRAMEARDKDKAGWRAHQASWVYYRRNQLADVQACIVRAVSYWEKETPSQKAAALRLLGREHELQKDYPAAIAAYHKALDIWRVMSAKSNIVIVLNELAEVERTIQDYETAERDFGEGLRIAKEINQQDSIASLTGNLALLALDREQWAEAESLAREALALAEKVGRQELIASDSRVLAKALLKQNNKQLGEALSMSRRAIEIFTRLRMSDNLQSAQETLAEIEEKINRE